MLYVEPKLQQSVRRRDLRVMEASKMTSLPDNEAKVLCIDDDEGILRYEKTALERRGYEVYTSTSAREGLRLALEGGFDGVIVDYDMPDLNGHQVASAIRRAAPHVPIIMFSASEVPEATRRVVSAFVSKPSVRRFVRTVCDLITLAVPQDQSNPAFEYLLPR